MKHFLFFVPFFLISLINDAQASKFQWAKQVGGYLSDAESLASTIDASGNVYSIGYFSGTVDFDPGSGIYNISTNSYDDAFISKLDNLGNFIWAKRIGGLSGSYTNVFSIKLDASGNIFITGVFIGSVDFDPGPGTFTMTTSGIPDIFILKLSSSGNFIWAKQLSGNKDAQSTSLTLDANANVYITGYFNGTVDFDPGVGAFNLTSLSLASLFILKLDSSGNFIWVKSMGGLTSGGIGNAINIDASGNTYTTGYFGGTVDFDPGNGVYNLSTSGSGFDIFIVKLNASGNFVWAKRIGNNLNDKAFAMTIDSSANIYTTGYFNGTVDFDPGAGTFNLTTVDTNDVFISKLDSSGNFIWAKKFGGPSDDEGFAITVDASANIYVCGYFYGIVDFQPDTVTFNLSSNSNLDVFISKFDSSGKFIWAKKMDGMPYSFRAYATSVNADNTGNVYTTGYFYGSVDFDPGDGIFNMSTLSSFSAGSDAFIHKINPCQPTYASFSFIACDTFILNGEKYYATGSYIQVISNKTGCDSVIHFYLKIKHSSVSAITASSCSSYTINSQTYSSSGIYTQKLINSVGCDSVITLNITIKQPTASSLYKTACMSYTVNNQTFTSSGVYTQKLTNVIGCDSILTLYLTIGKPSFSTTTISACKKYTFNSQTYFVSGVYSQTLLNTRGCDSTLTLNLTIKTVDNSVSRSGSTLNANATGAAYQWLKCPAFSIITGSVNKNFTPTVTGSYAVKIIQNGCTDTSVCYAMVVGINNTTINEEPLIIPNPSKDVFNVYLSNPVTEGYIELYNNYGGLVYRQAGINKTNTIEITDQADGIYFLIIASGDNIITCRKLLKQR